MVLTKKSENSGTMKLPHRKPQFPIDKKEKSGISERVWLLFVITYKKKVNLVFHNTIKGTDNDHAIRTAHRNFYLKKYSTSILEILIVILLNFFFP